MFLSQNYTHPNDQAARNLILVLVDAQRIAIDVLEDVELSDKLAAVNTFLIDVYLTAQASWEHPQASEHVADRLRRETDALQRAATPSLTPTPYVTAR